MLLPAETLQLEFSQVLDCIQGDTAPCGSPWDELGVHEQPSRIFPSAQQSYP